MSGANQSAVDPSSLIDDGRWTFAQRRIVAFCALALLVDGFDNGLLAVAAPALATEWGVERTAFAPAFAAGLIGLSVGTVLGGIVGDRIGRKPTLVACALMFGLMTLATVFVDGIPMLCLLRFIAGLGMGGALPAATTLASEFSPRSGRNISITIVLMGGPAGGLVGTLVAAWMLKFATWQTLFVTGGLAGLLLAALLMALLWESPAYMLSRPALHPRLRQVLAKINIALPASAELRRTHAREKGDASFSRLFSADLRRDTLTLWSVCFLYLLGLYSLISWGPSLLVSVGYEPAAASLGMSGFQAGTFIGSLSVGWLINRFGSQRLLWVFQAWTVGWLVLPLGVAVLSLGLPVMMGYLVVIGFLLNCTITAFYTVSAQAYPAEVRATGVGATVGAGRVGAVVSSFTAAIALAGSGSVEFFGLLAVCAGIALVISSRLTRHIPPATVVTVAGH